MFDDAVMRNKTNSLFSVVGYLMGGANPLPQNRQEWRS